jgi:hypothetical protein
MRKTKAEFLWYIADKYRAAGERWPATSKDIAAWAIRGKLWAPHPRGLIEQCAHEIAAAMREEMFIDSQGRRVRKKHAIRDLRELPSGKQEQLVLWVDISDATGEQMLKAFQYRRRLVLGDCAQPKTDVDSYNENNRHNAFIEMCFDFTEDLAELEQPVEYPVFAAEPTA